MKSNERLDVASLKHNSALWEYKGGQEDIHKISRKLSAESTLDKIITWHRCHNFGTGDITTAPVRQVGGHILKNINIFQL